MERSPLPGTHKSDCRTGGIESRHVGSTPKILKEVAGLYDQQRRFVTPKPSGEPVVFSLASWRSTGKRVIASEGCTMN
jgi:hypothetical protein